VKHKLSREARSVDGFLPLNPTFYSVLLALGDQDMHGYAIIQEFERKTGKKGGLLPGSLYNTIARMLKAGLVTEVDAPPAGESSDERRRYYRVTALGRAVARAESVRLKGLLALAEEAFPGR